MRKFESGFCNSVFFNIDKKCEQHGKNFRGGGYDYKRIYDGEDIKDNRYYKANLYVDSA